MKRQSVFVSRRSLSSDLSQCNNRSIDVSCYAHGVSVTSWRGNKKAALIKSPDLPSLLPHSGVRNRILERLDSGKVSDPHLSLL